MLSCANSDWEITVQQMPICGSVGGGSGKWFGAARLGKGEWKGAEFVGVRFHTPWCNSELEARTKFDAILAMDGGI